MAFIKMKQHFNKKSNKKSANQGAPTPLFDRDMRYVVGPIEHRDLDAVSETARSWVRATIIAPVAALGVIAIAVAASLDITASGIDQRTTANVHNSPSVVQTSTTNTALPMEQTPSQSKQAHITPVAVTPATKAAATHEQTQDQLTSELSSKAAMQDESPDAWKATASAQTDENAANISGTSKLPTTIRSGTEMLAVGGPGLHPAEDTTPVSIASRTDAQPETIVSESDPWRSVEIKRGDTLGAIFERFGFKIGDAIEIVKDNYASPLKNLIPGKTINLMASAYGGFNRLSYEVGVGKRIEVEAGSDAFKIRRIEQEPEIRQREVSGVVEQSLFASASRIGLNQNVIMQMADIFAYQIDFALDIRQGDRYSIIFEEKFIDEIKIGDGEIIAAEFVNDGNSHRAIRHIDEDNNSQYFTPDGDSLRRAFLRTPVKFSRISSGFSRKRFHPILKKWRAHKGVDYAARRGTPVLATADGKVSFAGRKGGYGKMIEIKHGKKYRTRYAHLHKFKSGVRSGAKVQQGDVIGYVGRTGWATGPHLHYEFHVNGKHHNPLTVKLPRSMSIEKRYRNQFIDNALILGGRLDALNANVASYDSGSLRRNNS